MLSYGRPDVGFGMLISQRNPHDIQFSDAQRDMMAMSLPTGGPKSFNSDMEIASDLCIFRAKDYSHCISKENMDNIRKTMMKHEALFREQVQALHKLYSIQKSAMHEIRQTIDSHAQMLTFNSNNIAVHDGQLCRAAGEENHSGPSCIPTQDCREGSLILSLHPICTIKEFTGYGPTLSWTNTKGKNFPTAQTKPRLEIDLERPPEDYVEESESNIEVNSYAMQGSNTNLLEGNRNTVEVSFKERNLSVCHTDSPNLKWRDPDKDFRTLPEPIQQMHQDCLQAPESKVHGIDMNKGSSEFYSRDESFQNILNDFPCNDLPAVGRPSANEELISSPNHQAEKPVCLHQGSLVVTSQRLNSVPNSTSPEPREHTFALARGCMDLACPPTYQPPTENNYMVLTPDLNKNEEKLQKGSTVEESPPTQLIICPQASSVYKSVQYDLILKDLNNLCIPRLAPLETISVTGKQNLCSWALTSETSEDDGGNNPNCSGRGSNSIRSDVGNICNDANLSTSIIQGCSKLVGECGETVHLNKVKTDRAQLELQEVPCLSNNSTETNLSSSIPVSEANHMDRGNCSNGSPGTAASHGEPVVTGSNEEPKNESTIEEACKKAAAKILLSFASCKSWGDESSDVQIKADTTRSDVDETESDKKQNLYGERETNCDNGGIEDETVEWTISLHGRKRRKLRRP
ncbi:hypothetical protein NE237_028673 [Protea cynaroides]|uniref:Uncharacterized protein n=1 Tax=Protea cynaroides TaxID=273540 RepID=A0A9Q0JU26_9MAGN|nr:hypothetical protein NE237_028673 [Protea cynaroides]